MVRDELVTIHHRNLQLLATEMFKVKTGAAPAFMTDVFSSNRNLGTKYASAGTRLQSHFYNPTESKNVYTGLETL